MTSLAPQGRKQIQGVMGGPSPEGETAYGPMPFNFATIGAGPILVDLTSVMQSGQLSAGRALFVDNANNGNTVHIYVQLSVPDPIPGTFIPSGQVIVAKPNTQGWYPLLNERPVIFNVVNSAGAGITNIWVTNYHVHPAVWSTV